MDKDGSTRWTIDIPPKTVQDNDKYVFRLVQARTKSDLNAAGAVAMSPSRGFVLKLPSTSSSVAVSASASRASSTTLPTSSASSNSGTTEKKEEVEKGTPVGAIVGGVIGGVALVALGVVAFFLLKRRKNKVKNTEYHQPPMITYAYGDEGAVPPKYKDAAAHQEPPPQELHGGQQIYEADNNFGQPSR